MNYYFESKKCQKCSHSHYSKHIGKLSTGWKFIFRAYEHENILSYQDWAMKFKDENKKIFNEDSEEISVFQFNEIISEKEDLINYYNVVTGKPSNEKEKIYLKNRINHFSKIDSSIFWKDSQGFTFLNYDFS